MLTLILTSHCAQTFNFETFLWDEEQFMVLIDDSQNTHNCIVNYSHKYFVFKI